MNELLTSSLLRLAVGWALAAGVMALLWRRQLRTGNAGVVDVAWAATIAGLAAANALFSEAPPARRGLFGAMGLAWGLRLAWHIHARSRGRPEDGRYAELRREWGADAPRRMFAFYQFQAVAAAFFALPFIAPALNPAPAPASIELAGALLWVVAVAGESAADRQLERFKRRPGTRGRTCRDGLWRYSRHPNYFFEWLAWCGFALFAAGSPGGAWAALCPAAMLYVILRVTGIPATEAQALRTRGDDYRAYQRTTSAFIPWFPRKESDDVVRAPA